METIVRHAIPGIGTPNRGGTARSPSGRAAVKGLGTMAMIAGVGLAGQSITGAKMLRQTNIPIETKSGKRLKKMSPGSKNPINALATPATEPPQARLLQQMRKRQPRRGPSGTIVAGAARNRAAKLGMALIE